MLDVACSFRASGILGTLLYPAILSAFESIEQLFFRWTSRKSGGGMAPEKTPPFGQSGLAHPIEPSKLPGRSRAETRTIDSRGPRELRAGAASWQTVRPSKPCDLENVKPRFPTEDIPAERGANRLDACDRMRQTCSPIDYTRWRGLSTDSQCTFVGGLGDEGPPHRPKYSMAMKMHASNMKMLARMSIIV